MMGNPPSPFPAYAQVRNSLLDQVQDLDHHEDLRMVVGCVVPPASGDPNDPPRTWIYPVDLSVAGHTSPKIDKSTPFLLGSTTKTFTATAYTLLYANMIGIDPEGQKINLTGVDLTTVFWNILSLSGYRFTPTFDELVTYTSGLIDIWDLVEGGPFNYEQLRLDLRWAEPENIFVKTMMSPQFFYSDLGFALLGMLMEMNYGKLNLSIGNSLATIMKSTIFDPLKLSSTGFFSSSNKGDIPAGVRLIGKVFKPADVGNSRFPAYDAGGGIVTTGSDLTRWLAFSMGLISGATAAWDPTQTDLQICLKTLLTPVPSAPTETSGGADDQTNFPCSGWMASCVGSTPQSYFKNGALSGASSYLVFTPWGTGQAGVCVMMNCGKECTTPSGVDLPAHVAYRVLDFLQNPSSADASP